MKLTLRTNTSTAAEYFGSASGLLILNLS